MAFYLTDWCMFLLMAICINIIVVLVLCPYSGDACLGMMLRIDSLWCSLVLVLCLQSKVMFSYSSHEWLSLCCPIRLQVFPWWWKMHSLSSQTTAPKNCLSLGHSLKGEWKHLLLGSPRLDLSLWQVHTCRDRLEEIPRIPKTDFARTVLDSTPNSNDLQPKDTQQLTA